MENENGNVQGPDKQQLQLLTQEIVDEMMGLCNENNQYYPVLGFGLNGPSGKGILVVNNPIVYQFIGQQLTTYQSMLEIGQRDLIREIGETDKELFHAIGKWLLNWARKNVPNDPITQEMEQAINQNEKTD